MKYVAPFIAVLVVAVSAHRVLLTWQSLMSFTILVILFIPIKRYVLPSSLPFQLEPYRIVVALIAAWMAFSIAASCRDALAASCASSRNCSALAR